VDCKIDSFKKRTTIRKERTEREKRETRKEERERKEEERKRDLSPGRSESINMIHLLILSLSNLY